MSNENVKMKKVQDNVLKDNDMMSTNFDNVFDQKYIDILNRLNDSGHDAYFVGGSIRDSLLGLDVNDVDITTSAIPEDVTEAFNDHKVLPIGIEHGTVVVMDEDEPIEITTFREDGEYTDSRRPDDVRFTKSLKEDVGRRDFTMNALAYSEKDGLVDHVGGIDDINNKLIRTVGNADKRFQEDPLRIMRGLRFASKLGFDIEDDTEKAIFENKHLLKDVSSERLQDEFNGLLMGDNAKDVLNKYSSVIAEFIPEIKPMIGFEQNNPNHKYDVWEHSAVVVESAKDDIAHKLAAVFHDSGKPDTYTQGEDGIGHFYGHGEVSAEIANEALTRLKYPNVIKDEVLGLVSEHGKELSKKPYQIGKSIYEMGSDEYLNLIDFKIADDMGKDLDYANRIPQLEGIRDTANEYLAGDPILSHRDLDIKPGDIKNLGFEGKEIGDALKELSLAAISGHKNEKDSQIQHLVKNVIPNMTPTEPKPEGMTVDSFKAFAKVHDANKQNNNIETPHQNEGVVYNNDGPSFE